MITQQDYNEYINKTITAQELAWRENVSRNQVYVELRKYKGSERLNRKLSMPEKAALAAELCSAVPYDSESGIKAVLARYRIKTAQQAYKLLGYKNLHDLKYGQPGLGLLLKRFGLIIVGTTIYARGNRLKPARHLILTSGDIESISLNPVIWLKENSALIREICLGGKRK